MNLSSRIVLAALLCLLGGQASADLILSTQPRGDRAAVEPAFQKLAQYLTRALGTPVRYEHADNWLSYTSNMQKGRYDIVFDGPAFIAWRMQVLKHEVIARVDKGPIRHVIAVRRDYTGATRIDDLAGITVCGRPSPNLATLVLLREFPNPMRQPLIVTSESYEDAYRKMIEGKCVAAVVGVEKMQKLNKDGAAREVFHSRPLPGQAITAGPRVTQEQKTRLAAVLTSPEIAGNAAVFLKKFAGDKPFVAGDPSPYRGQEALLRNEWGFAIPEAVTTRR